MKNFKLLYIDSKIMGDIKKGLIIKNLNDVFSKQGIKCKLMDCVDVCPVDCFYEGKNMLVIKPDSVRLWRL